MIAGSGEGPVGLAVDLLLDPAEGGLDVAEGLGAVHRLAVEPLVGVLGDTLLARREQAVDRQQYGEAASTVLPQMTKGHRNAEGDDGGGEDVAEADRMVEPPYAQPHGFAVALAFIADSPEGSVCRARPRQTNRSGGLARIEDDASSTNFVLAPRQAQT